MKTRFFFALCLAITCILSSVEVSAKAPNYAKAAKKQAKVFTKQGYEVTAGVQPIEMQLEKSYAMEDERNEKGTDRKYYFGTGLALGGNYRAAKLSATHAAKTEIASKIGEKIMQLVEEQVANKELTASEASSINKITAASKGLVAEELRNVTTVVEMFRYKGDRNKPDGVEVQVRLAYNEVNAEAAAKKVVIKELEKEAADTAAKLEKLMGFDF